MNCYADHLNTPRTITRPSDNAVVWKNDNTEPFGNSQPDENPSGLGQFSYNVRFPGQYFDQETGTLYNYYRDYDPSTGRYVESDPVGLKGGINTYGYVASNPLAAIDADGLCYMLVLPSRVELGRDDQRTGAWGKWKLAYPIIEGAEQSTIGGVPWLAYRCKCKRTRSVDWRYYYQARVRMVRICLTCASPSISEWDELGAKNYYRTQSLDMEQKTVDGELTMQSESWVEFACDKKCEALNEK